MNSNLIPKIGYFLMTAGMYNVYRIKSCFNDFVGYLLGFIVAVGVVIANSPLSKAYIVLTLVIILCLAVEKNLLNHSKLVDMLNTLDNPVNVGVGMHKLLHYNPLKHCFAIAIFMFIETIKILCGVYCIITLVLDVESTEGTWIIYWLLGALLFESTLGLILYFVTFVGVLCIPNFFLNWLASIADWNISDVVEYEVKIDNNSVISLQYLGPKIPN